jgi:hypothetical protein
LSNSGLITQKQESIFVARLIGNLLETIVVLSYSTAFCLGGGDFFCAILSRDYLKNKGIQMITRPFAGNALVSLEFISLWSQSTVLNIK